MNTRERVARGADLLDSKVDGWFNLINLETLDIKSIADCVLGQIASSSNGGIFITGMFAGMLDKLGIPDEAREFGFDGRWDEFDIINAAWVTEIAKRRVP